MNFVAEPGFCSECGSILPDLGSSGGVTCYTCKKEYGPEVFGAMETSYIVHFNNLDDYAAVKAKKKEQKMQDDEAAGPVVERKCPKCNNDKMSYTTLQLRSADEGQTIFFTCTKCKYKETENS
ncbi:DNA-directed RNA polymerase I subunit RPA12 [Schistocerca americana]|uniref:DNA-directed RNA polymerase I subunit RPA12 n=1 Tax=Schistocerca americana TaxID=7009 RepID=UPI001F4F555D|nr:DNA-directed RNA polymerase I subunit RPA12 [Schistocerca americana]XP_047117712.1 DNA-directed RNA polymerase I subunit RPA12 [Schistocerca piceifrons]XP_049816179.1 DNA-directed RNA polymerase I subunit RPA12 [Schistocerca nitens]XP_049830448.1 DNA-directed RNA polymerase I subunit RPA12 [Schistocerca gregaria]XP_049963360.1 DNA-directed RNA polymerase I subunit RPA12 [Schistocerca serialis cubense]